MKSTLPSPEDFATTPGNGILEGTRVQAYSLRETAFPVFEKKEISKFQNVNFKNVEFQNI